MPLNRHKIFTLAKVMATLLVAVAFGIVMQTLKGQELGLRNVVGNLSVPWLLLPYFAGRVGGNRRVLGSALVGLVASWTALGGFYAADPIVWNLGHQGFWANILLTMMAGKQWFVLACMSGPTFGALGALRARRYAVVIPVLILLEPVAHALATVATPVAAGSHAFVVWGTEFVIGVVAVFVVRHQASRETVR